VAQVDRSLPLPEDIADLRPDVIVLEDGELSARATHIPVSSDPANRVPVLVMTAVAAPGRSIQLLDAGADDVIGRPFDPIEFAARVRGLIRRRGQHLQAGTGAVGDALVDLDARMILRGGTSHSLTRPEWAMLARMMSRRGAIVSREELLTAAFGEAAHDDPALLRLTISRLRRKLGFDPWDEGAIRTVQGIGYAFDPEGVIPESWSPVSRGPRHAVAADRNRAAVAAGAASVDGAPERASLHWAPHERE
jgi:two-component system KDP operon response regulator KdpE